MVYPKYEEALRLGLEAFNNQMRVNKFYRPLPHILGSIEFQRHSHAGENLLFVRSLSYLCIGSGIIPVGQLSATSERPTSQRTPFECPPPLTESVDYHIEGGGATATDDDTYEQEQEMKEQEAVGTDWNAVKQAVTVNFTSAHRSYADFEALHDTDSKPSLGGSAASEADVEGYERSATLDPVSSVQALDGGLFDSDEAMSSALQNYRQAHKAAPKTRRPVNKSSSSRSQLTRSPAERSQASRDLEQLGKSINDLQQQRAAGNK